MATIREQYGEVVVVEDRKESDEDKKEWGLQNLRKNLETAIRSKKHTIVVKILQFLLFSCPDNRATKEEIIITCGITDFNHYTKWFGSSGRYMLIIPVQEYYKINPDVVNTITDIIPKLDF